MSWQGGGDDKGLREVKSILQDLQHIGARPLTPSRQDVSQPSGRSGEHAPARGGTKSGEAKSLPDRRPVQGRLLAALALTMLAAGAVIVLASDLFLKYRGSAAVRGSDRGSPAVATSGDRGSSAVATTERAAETMATPSPPIETTPPAPKSDAIDDSASISAPPPPPHPDIDKAHELMDSGRIAAARTILQRPDLAASQEGAWLLARSYDPNYLASIRSSDASADRRQAEEWYRRWRDIAARNGLVMDDMRLKRIIDSMR
jgi:hypothetical protein